MAGRAVNAHHMTRQNVLEWSPPSTAHLAVLVSVKAQPIFYNWTKTGREQKEGKEGRKRTERKTPSP